MTARTVTRRALTNTALTRPAIAGLPMTGPAVGGPAVGGLGRGGSSGHSGRSPVKAVGWADHCAGLGKSVAYRLAVVVVAMLTLVALGPEPASQAATVPPAKLQAATLHAASNHPNGQSSTSAATVKVWFLVGEQLVSVTRPGSTPRAAVQALLAGPTAAEYKFGYRTYVPSGSQLRSITVANGEATVDLSLNFALGSAQSLDARLSQLVHTASGFDGVTKVQLPDRRRHRLRDVPGHCHRVADHAERPRDTRCACVEGAGGGARACGTGPAGSPTPPGIARVPAPRRR